MESFESAVFFGTPVGIESATTKIYNLINSKLAAGLPVGDRARFAAMVLLFSSWSSCRCAAGPPQLRTVTGKGYSPNVARSAGCAG